MQGYFNRPEATAAVMRDGWFLTGDLGRVDASGRVTITGRKKEVIVLASGKNIYPEEIEGYYRQSAFVKEICVLGLTSEDDPTIGTAVRRGRARHGSHSRAEGRQHRRSVALRARRPGRSSAGAQTRAGLRHLVRAAAANDDGEVEATRDRAAAAHEAAGSGDEPGRDPRCRRRPVGRRSACHRGGRHHPTAKQGRGDSP